MENQSVTGVEVGTTATALRMKLAKPRRTHGLTPLIRGRYKADARQLDGRSALGQAMATYRGELLASLGGKDTLSAQELTLVEMCAKDWLILQTMDTYLFQVGFFNKRKKSAHVLTTQRMQIADSLTRRLQALGLARRAKTVGTLATLLAAPSKE